MRPWGAFARSATSFQSASRFFPLVAMISQLSSESFPSYPVPPHARPQDEWKPLLSTHHKKSKVTGSPLEARGDDNREQELDDQPCGC